MKCRDTKHTKNIKELPVDKTILQLKFKLALLLYLRLNEMKKLLNLQLLCVTGLIHK